jgi:hypothetical protein
MYRRLEYFSVSMLQRIYRWAITMSDECTDGYLIHSRVELCAHTAAVSKRLLSIFAESAKLQ